MAKQSSSISGKRAIEQLLMHDWRIITVDTPQTPKKTAKHNFRLAHRLYPNAYLSTSGETVTLIKDREEIDVHWKGMLGEQAVKTIQKIADITLWP